MSERKRPLDLKPQILEKIRGSARFLDRLRPEVVNLTYDEKDRMIVVSAILGVATGLGLDYLAPYYVSATLYQTQLPAPFWQLVLNNPFSTLITAVCLPLIASTTLSLVVKNKEEPPMPPIEPPQKRK